VSITAESIDATVVSQSVQDIVMYCDNINTNVVVYVLSRSCGIVSGRCPLLDRNLLGLAVSSLPIIKNNLWLSAEDTIMKKLLATLPLFLMITACDQAPPPADPSVISSRTDAWEAAINAEDIDSLAALYASDARLLPPNGEMVSGEDAVRAIFGGLIDAGISVDLTSVEAKLSGDMGYDVGTYTMFSGDTVVDTGKFIEIYHRGDDGEWLMTNDMWSSDVPVPAPAEEEAPMEEDAPAE
jgi:ketosteroid isomerase-like protein